jgi:site-specific recombinase XerD
MKQRKGSCRLSLFCFFFITGWVIMTIKKPYQIEMDFTATPVDDLLKQYQLHLEVLNRSPKTIIWYSDILSRFFHFLTHNGLTKPVQEVTQQDLEKYIRYRSTAVRWPNNPAISNENKGKLSPFSIQGEVRAIKVFWSWMFSSGYIEKNTFSKFPLPTVPKTIIKTLTVDQIKALLEEIDTNTATGLRNFCIVLLLVDTGMRISEATSIEISNLNLNLCSLKTMGKGQKERIIPFFPHTRKAILKYVTYYRSELCALASPYLFPARDGNHVGVNTIQQVLRRLAHKAGFGKIKIHPHLFRHTFATMFLAKGGNALVLKDILGHESIQTTQKYVHLLPEDLQKQLWKYSPLTDVLGK